MSDDINSPAHYMLFPGMESIDVIKAALTPEEFRGFCKGNALKYRLRAGDKGPAEKCIAKANWYQNRLRADAVIQPAVDVIPRSICLSPLNRCVECSTEDCPCLPL